MISDAQKLSTLKCRGNSPKWTDSIAAFVVSQWLLHLFAQYEYTIWCKYKHCVPNMVKLVTWHGRSLSWTVRHCSLTCFQSTVPTRNASWLWTVFRSAKPDATTTRGERKAVKYEPRFSLAAVRRSLDSLDCGYLKQWTFSWFVVQALVPFYTSAAATYNECDDVT
jgi:hypothetical protein